MARSGILSFLMILFLSSQPGLAAPTSLNYQGRILKADGKPLEYSNVAFVFQVTSPNGLCVLYEEQLNNVDMQNSGGVFDTTIGSGSRSFPNSGTSTILDVFNNLATSLPCKGGTTYSPTSNDVRKLRVQFHDGNGWRLISPDNTIRTVPFAGFSYQAAKLQGHEAQEFILKNVVPTCATNEFLSWNGTTFSCSLVSGSSGGTVTDVSSTNSYLSVANGTSTATITLNVGTSANTVAAGNDSRFTNSRPPNGTASGDLSGSYPHPTVVKIQGVDVEATTPVQDQVLTYDGAKWIPQTLPAASSGTVTNIATGTGLSGGPITTTGTISLGGPLLGLHNMASNGYIFRNGANTYGATAGSSNVGTNNLVLRDGSGTSSFYGVNYNGATSGSVLLKAADISTDYSLTLPDGPGTANQVLVTSGSTGILTWTNLPSFTGLTSLNGQTGASQTFGTPGASGTAPAWSSSGGVHTLNIPLASTTSVTAGLISKSDYDTFAGKQNSLGFTPLNPANNLSDVASTTTARTNLGLGTAATVNTGTTSGTIPLIGAGDKIPASLLPTVTGSGVTNTAAGNIAATTVQGAIDELDSEKVSKVGDTMTGTLNLPANGLVVGTTQLVVNGGQIGIGTASPSASLDIIGAIQISYNSEACAAAGDAGTLRYSGGVLQYCNGSAWQTVGTSTTTLTSLNSQTGAAQIFGTPGSSGTAPTWSSASNVHTLNIPMASATGVTAGLLSKTDYDSFVAKQPALGFTPLNPANNLSDVGSASTARANLGLGTAATANTGTTNGTIPLIGAGDRIPAALIPNLAGSTITNTPAGSIAATTAQAAIDELDSEKVAKAGDTMTGALNLPSNGLVVGTNQLLVSGGNVGIGTSSPGQKLEVDGNIKISGMGNGITFPDGTTQTTAPTSGASGEVSFHVTKSSTQALTAGAPATVSWQTKASDVGNYFNLGTNRFQPLEAGKYLIHLSVGTSTNMPDTGTIGGYILKNGSAVAYRITHASRSDEPIMTTVTALVELNGTTDYVTFQVATGSSSQSVTNNVTTTFAQGFKIGGSVVSSSGSGSTNYVPLWTNGTSLGNSPIAVSSSNVGIGTTTPSAALDVVGAIQISYNSEPCATAADAGTIRYSAGAVQYCNGSAWQAMGSGSGMSSLNSQTGSSQTFGTPGTTGTAPAWSSASNVHTLNIPLASGAGVTAGLLSKTDYDAFTAKQSTTLGHNQVLVGNSSSVATARFFGIGDVRTPAGVAQFPSSCTAAQTMIWSAVTDVFSCTNITGVAAANITNTAAGNIAATNVQAALNELDTEKVSKAGDTMTGALTVNGLIESTTGGIKFPDGSVQTTSASSPGTNNTMITSWPDIILCTVTSPNMGVVPMYATYMPYTSDGRYYYRANIQNGTNYGVAFTSAGAFALHENLTTTNCNISISALYTAGRAFNIAKGPAAQWLQSGNNAYYNAGNVGIGTTNPTRNLSIVKDQDTSTGMVVTNVDAGTAARSNISLNSEAAGFEIFSTSTTFSGNYGNLPAADAAVIRSYSTPASRPSNMFVGTGGSDPLHLMTAQTPRLTLTSAGNILVGTDTVYATDASITPKLQVHGPTATAGSISATAWVANASSPGTLVLGRSRSGTVGTRGLVQNGDAIGGVYFNADDGANFLRAAFIESRVDGDAGTSDMPGRLVFSTTADGSSSPSERMRITSAGNVGIGTTNPLQSLVVGSTADLITDTRAVTIQSKGYAALFINGDAANTSGEPGGSFVGFRIDGVQGALTTAAHLIGSTNVAGTAPDGTTFTDTIGNAMVVGTTNTSPLQLGSNAAVGMTIISSGNVGIGTTNPSAPLHVSTTNVTGNIATFVSTGSGGAGCSIAWNGVSCSSDSRLKENVVPTDSNLIFEKLMLVEPVNFTWISDKDHQHQTGFIAQKLEALFPEFVKTDVNGYKQVNYSHFVSVLTSAIQELYHRWSKDSEVIHRELASLTSADKMTNDRTAKLEVQNARLEAENRALKDQVQRQAKDLDAIKRKLGL